MKKVLFFLIGNLILSFGVSTLIYANLGTGAWDAFFVGLSKTIGLTTGYWIFIIGAILIFINAYLLKERPDIMAFLNIFIVGLFIDFFNKYFYQQNVTEVLMLKIFLFIIGVLCFAFGISLYLQSQFAKSPIDNLMLSIHKKFNISVRLSRTLSESFAVIMALIFNGPVFIGTAIIILIVGYLIQLFLKPCEIIYNKF